MSSIWLDLFPITGLLSFWFRNDLSDHVLGVPSGEHMAMPRKEPTPIDKLVGRNIRIHRMKKNMSQEKLGDSLGLTFQQVQKYEKGTNRVGAGRLHQIAGILGIPVTALFEGSDVQPDSGGSMLDLLAEPYSLRLIQAMAKIADNELRRTVVELVEQIAASQGIQPDTTKRRTGAGRH